MREPPRWRRLQPAGSRLVSTRVPMSRDAADTSDSRSPAGTSLATLTTSESAAWQMVASRWLVESVCATAASDRAMISGVRRLLPVALVCAALAAAQPASAPSFAPLYREALARRQKQF